MKHILTEEDLQVNPGLVDHGLKVGDEIEITDEELQNNQQGAPLSPAPTEKKKPVIPAKPAYAHALYDKFEVTKKDKEITLTVLVNTRPLTENEVAEESKFLNNAQPNPVYLLPAGQHKVGDVVILP